VTAAMPSGSRLVAIDIRREPGRPNFLDSMTDIALMVIWEGKAHRTNCTVRNDPPSSQPRPPRPLYWDVLISLVSSAISTKPPIRAAIQLPDQRRIRMRRTPAWV
jgi:hypothetical protein